MQQTTYTVSFFPLAILVAVVGIVLLTVFLRVTGRRFQFSLRGVLMLTAFVAVVLWLAMQGYDNMRMRRRIRRLENELGAQIQQGDVEQRRLKNQLEQLEQAAAAAAAAP